MRTFYYNDQEHISHLVVTKIPEVAFVVYLPYVTFKDGQLSLTKFSRYMSNHRTVGSILFAHREGDTGPTFAYFRTKEAFTHMPSSIYLVESELVFFDDLYLAQSLQFLLKQPPPALLPYDDILFEALQRIQHERERRWKHGGTLG